MQQPYSAPVLPSRSAASKRRALAAITGEAWSPGIWVRPCAPPGCVARDVPRGRAPRM